MRTVADRAGVSPMTVSYILRGRTDLFRPETCAKVQEAIAALGYVPSRSPRSMRTGRHNAIGFVGTRATPDDVSWFSRRMLDSMLDAAVDLDLDLIYTRLAASDEKPRLLREACVDGLIVNAISYMPAGLLAKLARRYPLVQVNEQAPTDAVYPDEESAGQTAAAWLLERGHRRLAFVQFLPDSGHFSFPARRRGFTREARQHGATVASLVPDAAILGKEQLTRTADFLAETRPDAVCCLGGSEAACVLEGLAAHGLSAVPIAFNEVMVSLGVRQIATVIIPYREIGRQAVAMLFDKINRPGPRPAILAPATDVRCPSE